MEPLWQDIQQELKIVESEEELSFPATAPEKVKQQESEFSPILISPSEANSVVCSSVLPFTAPKEEAMVRKTPIIPHFPLFGVSSKESKDSSVFNSELFRKQEGDSSTLSKLENTPCGISCPKDCLKDGGSRSDFSLLAQEQKLPSKPLESTALLRDELSSHPKEKHLDEPQWEGNSWILEKENEEASVLAAEESDKEISEREDLTSSKNVAGVGSHQLEGRIIDHPQDSLDQQDEDSWVDHVQSLELVEPWEDHQWVTSPLHSPTFKDTQRKVLQEAQSHFKKPCFSRSFSLDSKDFVKRHCGVPVLFLSANDEHFCNFAQSGVKLLSEAQKRETDRVEAWLNLSEESSKLIERVQKPLSNEVDFATIELPSLHSVIHKESGEKEVYESKENQDVKNHLESSLPQFNTGDSLSNPSEPLEDTSFAQEADNSAAAVMKDSAKDPQDSKSEDIPRKERPRPSSLNLDSVLPAASLFNFESLSVPTPPRHFIGGQKEIKTSDSVPSLPVACPNKTKADLWGSHFDPQELDLDYIMMAHATTGRRNSAPVSVSAVRTSFMVKMCQARAVPVIPPKIQYTQVPQPLQTQNPNCRTQLKPENKEVEATVSQCKSNHNAQGQLQPPKSPTADRKGKENSNAAFVDLTASRKVEPSFSNHNSTQDAPVLRRKRTSEGETTGDNPQSSKMERPSGASKPSYRSRPGRPQSLILFSPPFPIMDYPSSSADSRVLLSPIRSPSQTPSPSPISNDLSGTVSEGVTLRNKMTIPKNGQRLETSTSCFYQPQRRSVILDGRSGREIE